MGGATECGSCANRMVARAKALTEQRGKLVVAGPISGEGRVGVVRCLAIVEGAFPSQPDVPILSHQLERLLIDGTQSEDLSVNVFAVVPLRFIEMRVPVEVSDAATWAIVVVVDRVDFFERCRHFVARQTYRRSIASARRQSQADRRTTRWFLAGTLGVFRA